MSRRSASPHRGGGLRRARHLTLTVGLGLLLGTTAIAAPANASPQSELASKTAQARRLEAQVQANADRADALDEQYLQAQDAVAAANHQISVAEQGIAATESRQADLRQKVGGRAAMLYMGAGNGDPLGIDATSVQDFGSRAKYGEAAAETDNRMIDQLRVLDEQLQRQTKDLERQRSDAQHRQHDADVARKQVAQLDQQTRQLLAHTRSDIRTLAAQIEQQRIAAEQAAARARVQAELARQAAEARSATRQSHGVGIALSADVGVDPGSIPAPNAGAQAAIAYARQQIGKPYVYAGTGPGSFDCSGLTMMAWAQGGVSMAHGSQAQYLAFPKVPISMLQPGDLVFFGASGPTNHHVGLYIGGGTMIEAPHTGAYVRYSTIYRSDLVPLGSRP